LSDSAKLSAANDFDNFLEQSFRNHSKDITMKDGKSYNFVSLKVFRDTQPINFEKSTCIVRCIPRPSGGVLCLTICPDGGSSADPSIIDPFEEFVANCKLLEVQYNNATTRMEKDLILKQRYELGCLKEILLFDAKLRRQLRHIYKK